MTDRPESGEIERLEPLIGEWQMHAVFPSASPIDTSKAQGAVNDHENSPVVITGIPYPG
jgi:hypothetical protein